MARPGIRDGKILIVLLKPQIEFQMQFLRTPEASFANISDFNYSPNHIEINGGRMHYIDEGRGEIVLCLHGEPSWCYLYRKFIPILEKKYRVVAPDFFGFGKSDKPSKMSDYSYQFHLDSLLSFIDTAGLKNITVVVQDWGGLLGLGAVGARPGLFSRLVIMNTFLPVGKRKFPPPFKIWRAFAKYYPGMPVGGVVKMGCYQPMNTAVKAAYDAPFPSNKYKAGAKAWPLLVPEKPTDPGVKEMLQAREVLYKWNKPALVMFSDKDPIMRGGDKFFRGKIPSAKNEPMITIKDAGHFLQEDKGEEIARHIDEFMKRNPLSSLD